MIESIKNFANSIDLARWIAVLVIFAATYFLAKIVKVAIHKKIQKSSKLMKTEVTEHKFLGHLLTAMIYLVGIGLAIYLIPPLRALSVSLLAGAGILAVVVGFASQQAFSNFISGIVIILSKPYRVDDIVKVGDKHTGVVEDITLRHTVIRTFENKRVIIPNLTMNSETLENANIEDSKICKFVEFSISYDSDIDKAMKIIKEEAVNHPNFLDVRTKEDKKKKVEPVTARVIGFGDSSVNLRAWVWAADPFSAFVLGCDLNKSIKERFDKEGIEIPFPYRTVVYKKDINKKR